MGDDDPDFERVINEYNRPVQYDPEVENLSETVLEHMENVHKLDREMTIKVRAASDSCRVRFHMVEGH